MKNVFGTTAILFASSISHSAAKSGNDLSQCFPNSIPWYTYDSMDYIFSRQKYNSVCIDGHNGGQQYEWGKIEGIYPPIDEPDGGCSSVCVSGYGRGEARGCTSMKPEKLVGFEYNCDENACYCLYETKTWSGNSSPCFDSMDISNRGHGPVASTAVEPGSTCYSLETQPAPTPAPTPEPGSSICTYAPDYDCYQTGWPPCCDDDSEYDCPSFPTMCNNHPERMRGASYCTYSPDYSCYHMGWPDCCGEPGGDFMNCPKERPPCESDVKHLAAATLKFLRGN